MISNDDIKREFLAAGFTLKPGHDDLKPYVYEAARRLLALAAAESETMLAAERERWRDLVGQLVACHEDPTCPAVEWANDMLAGREGPNGQS